MANDNREYILEFIELGGSVKVSAIDPVTQREVSIVGSPKATRQELTQIAVRKLEYVLAKEKGEG